MPESVPKACLEKYRQDKHENSSSGTPVSETVVQAFFLACLEGWGLAVPNEPKKSRFVVFLACQKMAVGDISVLTKKIEKRYVS